MKRIYFKWSPISTGVLVITIALLVWYLITGINLTGFLAIMVIFILRDITWTGYDKEEIVKLNKEIEFLKTQKK